MNKIIEDTIAYLEGVDLSALTIAELKGYADTVNVVRGMVRPDAWENILKATSGFALGKAEEPESGYAVVDTGTTKGA